eukprot:COSAG01_NODE_31640_length_594_cov_0.701010_2_plen_112_part_01
MIKVSTSKNETMRLHVFIVPPLPPQYFTLHSVVATMCGECSVPLQHFIADVHSATNMCTGAIFVHFTVLRRSCTLRRMIRPPDPRRNKYNEDVVVLATPGPRVLATIDGAGF